MHSMSGVWSRLAWISVVILIAIGLPAAAQQAIEVSEDGLVSVRPEAGEEARGASEEVGGSAAGHTVSTIFGSAPDWSNTLRVQVGGLDVADIDGDGDQDVVVGCYSSSSYPPYEDWHNFIYRNTGTELEATPSWISDDERSTGDVHVAFINDDVYPDIVAGNGGFSMSPSVVYFGTASGPSTAPGWLSSDSAWTNYALPFDFDHDGDVDLVTANQGNNPDDAYRPIYIFFNNNGTLATTPGWQSAEISIQNFLAFGDMDGDGWEDLAVAKWSGFASGVYQNVNGTIQTTPIWTTGTTTADKGVVWGDVTQNGWMDLALGRNPTTLYTNDHGTLTSSWISTASYFGHSDLKLVDVDLDGDPDLAEVHFSNGVVNLYLNDKGQLSQAPSWSYDSDGAGTAIAFGLINDDPYPDLVVGNSGNPSVMVFYQSPPAAIFTDGFESGNLTMWTTSAR